MTLLTQNDKQFGAADPLDDCLFDRNSFLAVNARAIHLSSDLSEIRFRETTKVVLVLQIRFVPLVLNILTWVYFDTENS
jgi:hypothetical protein